MVKNKQRKRFFSEFQPELAKILTKNGAIALFNPPCRRMVYSPIL